MGRPRVPESKRLEFREKLLELGVVRQAAMAVEIPVSTGYDIARELEKEELFVKQREELRARVLPEVESRLLAAAEKISGRVIVDDPSPSELAEIAVKNGLKSFSYQNPKPQYFRGLVDFYKAIDANRKRDEVTGGNETGPAVVINLSGSADANG